MGRFHDLRFPGESEEYRAARDRLTEAEVALRRQTEVVANLRRALPLGGPLKEDYVFDEGFANPARGDVRNVRFSDLFSAGKDSLVVYNFMYAPGAAAPCPMCTAFVDSLDGAVQHLEQRINIALVARAPIEAIVNLARRRGWREIRLLSSRNNSFNADYHAERSTKSQRPVLSVFRRVGERIHHTYSTEMLYFPGDAGQDPRHIDIAWPLWNVLDMVPEGRGTDWYPSLSYDLPEAVEA